MKRAVLAVSISMLGAACAQDKYAGEPLVVLRNDRVYQMNADGTGVVEQTISGRIQSESGLKQMGVVAVPFASRSSRVEWVYARVKHADGAIVETPVAGAIEVTEQVTREAPFYSDLKESQLPLKDLRVGDTLEWQARVVMTTAEAPGNFWGQENFATGAVVLEQSIEVDAPKDLYLNAWGRKAKPVETISGNTQIWRWTNQELKPTVGADADTAKEAEKKRIRTADEELDERQGKLPDLAWTTFKSWEAVGAWYRGLEGERMQPDAAVKAKVAQLTAGKTTEEEKVQAVYSYVGLQIHYIGVAFGVGRYQPHAANEVMDNQYGDCKDKHTLLAAMLEGIGLHPDAVLIGAGIRFNQAVPSPASFNHLITRVSVDGKKVWLDSTAEVAPYGHLMYVIRDRSALLIPETGTSKVETTPALPPFKPTQTMVAVGTLNEDGVSESRMTFTFRGDDEVLMRTLLRRISPSQYGQMAQGMLCGMGYQGEPSHVEVNRSEDTTVPLEVAFDYKRVKGGDWANHRTLAQLSPVLLPRPDENEPPVESVELGIPRVESSKATMKLPEGWGVLLPDPIHQKTKWASVDETYAFKNGVLTGERRLEVFKDRVPQAEWKDYAKFVEAADLSDEHYLQLVPHEKTEAYRTPKTVTIRPSGEQGALSFGNLPVAGPFVSVPDMGSPIVIKHVLMMADSMELKVAQAQLDGIKVQHPEQPQLWSQYGHLAERRGNLPEALEDYRKEMSLHPAEVETAGPLAEVQWKMGQAGDAEATLRTWIDANAKGSRAWSQLSGYLTDDGKPGEAVKIAKEGLARMPDDDPERAHMEVVLGRAELAAYDHDAARDALVAAIRSARDAEISNSAAYELANAGLELTLADVTLAENVNRMEYESQSWTLANYPVQIEARQLLLESTWESMGWVLFREGKLKEAESYARAAWLGNPTMRSGQHLGEIEQALGDSAEAMKTYAMATQAPGTNHELEALLTKMSFGHPEKIATEVKNRESEFAKLRVFPLATSQDVDGTSAYRVIVSAQRVEAVKSTEKTPVPGGEERVASAALPALFPKGSKARLVRHVKLTCKTSVCELSLED